MERQVGQRDWIVAVLLSSFIGFFGADRFYLGRIGSGIAKLLTFGGLGIWAIVDTILIIGNKLPDDKGVLPYKKVPPVELVESGQVSKREWVVALLYSIFFGWLGLDRFYLGHKKLGFFKLSVFLVSILLPLVFIILSAIQLNLFNEYDTTYHTFMRRLLIFIIVTAILAVTALILWIVDLVLIAMNRFRDAEGKILWK